MNRFFDQQKRALAWALVRGLCREECIQPQLLKLVEEVGELVGAVNKGNTDAIKNELGDVLVVLTIFADQVGLDFTDCLTRAVDKIDKRTGTVKNGLFIKDDDATASPTQVQKKHTID